MKDWIISGIFVFIGILFVLISWGLMEKYVFKNRVKKGGLNSS